MYSLISYVLYLYVCIFDKIYYFDFLCDGLSGIQMKVYE